jgi:hypothetical protein
MIAATTADVESVFGGRFDDDPGGCVLYFLLFLTSSQRVVIAAIENDTVKPARRRTQAETRQEGAAVSRESGTK